MKLDIQPILDKIQNVKIAVYGDLCLDAYWILDPNGSEVSGILNIGTGNCQSFKEMAESVIDYHGKGEIEFIPFPDHLKGSYQSFTEADLTKLRNAGYDAPFKTVQEGVKEYMEWLHR